MKPRNKREAPACCCIPLQVVGGQPHGAVQQAVPRGGRRPSGPDSSNPLPEVIDPITLETVVTPAISPFGHVMGMATWKVIHFLCRLPVLWCALT